MGELIFVGLGLYDERDISLRALDELKTVPSLFSEEYTSRLSPGSLERLGRLLGREVRLLSREEVEGERVILEDLERRGRVAFLVAGEPFAATTHLSLRLAVERAGHGWRVLHNASILTAAASLVGLSQYRFGRVVSIPDPATEGHRYRPSSPYEAVVANAKAGLHTLILLDLDPVEGRYLTADAALRRLGEMEEGGRGGVAGPEALFCVTARVGGPDAMVWVGARRELEGREFGPPLHSLILPAPNLHFLEKEALERWRERAKGSSSTCLSLSAREPLWDYSG